MRPSPRSKVSSWRIDIWDNGGDEGKSYFLRFQVRFLNLSKTELPGISKNLVIPL